MIEKHCGSVKHILFFHEIAG